MKKIIILTSAGGRGHISVTHALQSYLKDLYLTQPVFIFSEVLRQLDLVQILTRNRYTGEDVYNFLLRKKWYRLINLFYTVGARFFSFNRKKSQAIIKQYLKEQAPDMVISVIPLVNDPIIAAARELNLPCLIIPTDLDNTTFIYGMKPPYDKNFHYALPLNDGDIKRTVEPAHIPAAQISATGFILRKAFFNAKDPAALKQSLQIPPHKPVILILFGGQGSRDFITFAKELAALPVPAHLIFCIGKSELLAQQLDAIAMPSRITTTILGFTEQIDDIMAIADICISKSGSLSVCEALFMNLPLILDATSGVLAWEKLNHRFIQTHNLGLILTHRKQTVPTVMKLLGNSERLRDIKKNLVSLEKRTSPDLIRQLISQILADKSH